MLCARRPASRRKYYQSVGSGKGVKWQQARSDRSQQGLTLCVNRTVKLAINMKRVAFERNTRLGTSPPYPPGARPLPAGLPLRTGLLGQVNAVLRSRPQSTTSPAQIPSLSTLRVPDKFCVQDE